MSLYVRYQPIALGGGGGASLTIGTYDSQTKVANALVITGGKLYAQSADATHPGMVSTGAQTWAGDKTFTGITHFPGSTQINATGDAFIGASLSSAGQLATTANGTATTQGFKMTGKPFAGTATTSKALLLMQTNGDPSTGWNTNGTYIGVNPTTGFIGNLMDLQINAVSQFSVDYAGVVTATGTITGSRLISNIATGTAPLSVASTTLVPNLYVARAVLADSATVSGNLTGPITSVGNATSIASQTGTGTTFAMSADPTFTGAVTGLGTLAIGATLVANTQSSWTSPTTVTGTCSNSAGGIAVAGSGTKFLSEFHIGDTITMNAETRTVATITSDIALTTDVWTGANSAGTVATKAAVADAFVYPNGIIQSGGSRTTLTNINNVGNIIAVGNAASGVATAIANPSISIINYTGNAAVGSAVPTFNFYRMAGTEASFTNVLSGSNLGNIIWRGASSSSTNLAGARIRAFATQDFASGAAGTKMEFQTVPNSSGTLVTALTIDQDQSATFAGNIKNGVAGNEFTGDNQTVVMGGADGPAGVTLSKVSGPTKWLKILDSAGAAAYIPIYQ